MTTQVLLATGAYTSPGRGRARGIGLLRVTGGSPEDGLRAEPVAEVPAEDPSFLLWSADGRLLHAVLETSPTRLLTLVVSEDADGAVRAEVAGELTLRGSGGCHLAAGRREGTLVVAHYGSGEVETVLLDAEGVPVETLEVDDHHEGSDGPDPHPHQVVVLPATDLLGVPDLGLDRVYLYRQTSSGVTALAGEIVLPRGSGPRHLVPDHESSQIHVACELSGSVATATRTQVPPPSAGLQVMRRPRLEWTVRSVVPASGSGTPNAVSHLELTADEGLLLVANRGPDSLALLSLTGLRPHVVAEVPVGEHPRHFTRLPLSGRDTELVLVAAQEADRVTVLLREGETLRPVGAPLEAPSVTCLAVRP